MKITSFQILYKNKYYLFASITFIVFTAWSFLFQPVISGDSLSYIYNAEQLIGKRTVIDNASRGPGYIVLLAGLNKLFGDSDYLVIIVWLQYFLLWIGGLIIYKIIIITTGKNTFAWLAGLYNTFSLSSINYGSQILSESLTLFIFVFVIYMLFRKEKPQGILYMILTGIITSLLFLTRLNMLSLTFWIMFFIFYYYFFVKKYKINQTLIRIGGFLGPVVIITLLWSYRNVTRFGFFAPFPPEHCKISLNALYATIDERTKTKTEYEQFKVIINESRKDVLSEVTRRKPGTLILNQRISEIARLNLGYRIRNKSYNRFKKYFEEENISAESWSKINFLLKDFHEDVLSKNPKAILKIRFYSLFAGFRSAITSLPSQPDIKDTNAFIEVFLRGYRILFICMTLLFFLFGIIYIVLHFLTKAEERNYLLFLLITLIFYIHFINFALATTNDAARYKFPLEALTFGIILYLIGQDYGGIKNILIKNRKTFVVS